jgi:hypothetical protein
MNNSEIVIECRQREGAAVVVEGTTFSFFTVDYRPFVVHSFSDNFKFEIIAEKPCYVVPGSRTELSSTVNT